MTASAFEKDLMVLTADGNAEAAIRGILSRHKSLGIRPIIADFHTHPRHDPGVLGNCHEFLRAFTQDYAHALVFMDREGCGAEELDRESLEDRLRESLRRAGWDDRAEAVVFDPELEIWVWSDSPWVDKVLGWKGRDPGLRAWLCSQGLLSTGDIKPAKPKEALEKALRIAREPRSSSMYGQLARHISLNRCQDPAFLKLKGVLASWFE
jgi:hypothetical protein